MITIYDKHLINLFSRAVENFVAVPLYGIAITIREASTAQILNIYTALLSQPKHILHPNLRNLGVGREASQKSRTR